MLTLAGIWSGVRERLADPNAAAPGSITVEANNALNELRGRIRQSREDWLDIVEKTDILADKDVYDYPPSVDTLKMIERLDLASDHGIFPSQPMSYHEQFGRGVAAQAALVVADTVTVLPDRRIRIMPTPTATYKDGIRWTFLPKIVPMASPDDAALIPEPFEEWLIVGTIDRLKQMRGVELVNPRGYEQFRNEQTLRVLRELRPKELHSPLHIIDEDEFYSYTP